MAGRMCVLTIIDGYPCSLVEADHWDHALTIALETVKSKDPSSAEVIPDEEILKELEEDTYWVSNQGDIRVDILMTEDSSTLRGIG